MRLSLTRTHRGLLGAALLAMPAAVVFAAPPPMPEYTVPEYAGVDDIQPIRLTLNDWINAPGGDNSIVTTGFVEYVNKATKGKVEIEVFWSGSLLPAAEAAAGIAAGTADMGGFLPLYTPTDLPVNNFFNQLSSLSNGGFPASVLITTGAVAEFMILNKDIQKEFNDFGLQVIGGSGGAGYDTYCNKPWDNLENAKGKRTRAAGQSFAKEAQSLGMVPVPTTATEIYEAFTRGILDCIILQAGSYATLGLTDVPGDKFWVNVPLTAFNGSVFVVNKEKWDALPPVVQQVLIDGQVFATTLSPIGAQVGWAKMADQLSNGKIKFIPVAPEVDKHMADFQAQALTDLPSIAPAGVPDPKAFIDQYRTVVDKWTKIVTDLGYPNDRKGVTDVNVFIKNWKGTYDYSTFNAKLREELTKDAAAAK